MPLSWDQDEYIKAYRFAAEAHKGQWVEGTTDVAYIVHPSLVSMEIMAALQLEQGIDGNLALQCALLHDVIEDKHASFGQVKSEFGEKVASGVQALSKNRTLRKPIQMEDSLIRIKQQPREIWMVKLADRITNLQPPPKTWSFAKIADYREEAIRIHDALASANDFLAQRLKFKIGTYSGGSGDRNE